MMELCFYRSKAEKIDKSLWSSVIYVEYSVKTEQIFTLTICSLSKIYYYSPFIPQLKKKKKNLTKSSNSHRGCGHFSMDVIKTSRPYQQALIVYNLFSSFMDSKQDWKCSSQMNEEENRGILVGQMTSHVSLGLFYTHFVGVFFNCSEPPPP